MLYQESNIVNIKDGDWNLRSALSLLEGGNMHMLDYVKHKPRWRPPRGSNDKYSEDVLAFKQIYMSKAAATYRQNLAKKVDDIFYNRITDMREEDAAKEEMLQAFNTTTQRDPFQHIFEKNNVSEDMIPASFRAPAKGKGLSTIRERAERKGRNAAPMMKRESPSVEVIKRRISTRRSSLSSFAMSTVLEEDASARSGSIGKMMPSLSGLVDESTAKAVLAGYKPQGTRRRGSDHSARLVGEVGKSTIQDKYDDYSVGDLSYGRPMLPDDEDPSHSSRANMSQLGNYRRVSSGVSGEGSQSAAPRRPMYREPQS